MALQLFCSEAPRTTSGVVGPGCHRAPSRSDRTRRTMRPRSLHRCVPPALCHARPVRAMARRPRGRTMHSTRARSGRVAHSARSQVAPVLSEAGACADLTTTVLPARDLAAPVAGFVAAEGHLGASGTGTRLRLAVGLAAVDEGSCQLLLELFGIGTITRSPRRRAHEDDEGSWQVQWPPDLVEVVVPFMDDHLPPSHERDRYEVWRAALLERWVTGCRAGGCAHERVVISHVAPEGSLPAPRRRRVQRLRSVSRRWRMAPTVYSDATARARATWPASAQSSRGTSPHSRSSS